MSSSFLLAIFENLSEKRQDALLEHLFMLELEDRIEAVEAFWKDFSLLNFIPACVVNNLDTIVTMLLLISLLVFCISWQLTIARVKERTRRVEEAMWAAETGLATDINLKKRVWRLRAAVNKL